MDTEQIENSEPNEVTEQSNPSDITEREQGAWESFSADIPDQYKKYYDNEVKTPEAAFNKIHNLEKALGNKRLEVPGNDWQVKDYAEKLFSQSPQVPKDESGYEWSGVELPEDFPLSEDLDAAYRAKLKSMGIPKPIANEMRNFMLEQQIPMWESMKQEKASSESQATKEHESNMQLLAQQFGSEEKRDAALDGMDRLLQRKLGDKFEDYSKRSAEKGYGRDLAFVNALLEISKDYEEGSPTNPNPITYEDADQQLKNFRNSEDWKVLESNNKASDKYKSSAEKYNQLLAQKGRAKRQKN